MTIDPHSASERDSTPQTEGGTQALVRALNILQAFTVDQPERRISDVGRELGLHKSTAGRLFRALADAGFLQRSEEKATYRLGPAVFDLGSRFLASLDLQAVAQPLIARLAREEGESVNVAVLDRLHAISIARTQGSVSPQLMSRLDWRIPASCSAAGKVLLAGRSDEEVREILADNDWRALTERTVTDLETFIEELAVVRRRGWALNDQESEEGLRVVAAPVRDGFGVVVASISVSGPIFRLDDERVEEIAAAAIRTAGELSRQLGFFEPVAAGGGAPARGEAGAAIAEESWA